MILFDTTKALTKAFFFKKREDSSDIAMKENVDKVDKIVTENWTLPLRPSRLRKKHWEKRNTRVLKENRIGGFWVNFERRSFFLLCAFSSTRQGRKSKRCNVNTISFYMSFSGPVIVMEPKAEEKRRDSSILWYVNFSYPASQGPRTGWVHKRGIGYIAITGRQRMQWW